LQWNDRGDLIKADHTHDYARTWFYRGWTLANHPGFKNWIQQEATFWRRSVWEAAGGRIDDTLQYAGDYELWARFWQQADLATTTIPLAGWRRQPSQKTAQMDRYYAEAEAVLARYRRATLHHSALLWLLERLLALSPRLMRRLLAARPGQRLGSHLTSVEHAPPTSRWKLRSTDVV
jgi:hypothetical protein